MIAFTITIQTVRYRGRLPAISPKLEKRPVKYRWLFAASSCVLIENIPSRILSFFEVSVGLPIKEGIRMIALTIYRNRPMPEPIPALINPKIGRVGENIRSPSATGS